MRDVVVPYPEPDEVVVYDVFFTARLGLPVSPLITGVLEQFGLELS